MLIATGMLAAYVFSVLITFIGGETFFEAAAMLVTFVLFGYWMEMRSRRGANETLLRQPIGDDDLGDSGLPRVSVPVLSRTIAVIRRVCSSADRPSVTTPSIGTFSPGRTAPDRSPAQRRSARPARRRSDMSTIIARPTPRLTSDLRRRSAISRALAIVLVHFLIRQARLCGRGDIRNSWRGGDAGIIHHLGLFRRQVEAGLLHARYLYTTDRRRHKPLSGLC